jgi:hypothetical protein
MSGPTELDLNSPYLRIVEFFDKDETAGSFLSEDGDGGFVGAVYRMAREIDRLRALPASGAGWRDVKAELPPLEQVVIIRYPSWYDGGDVFAWGARVDDGEGWLWGVKTGYDASVRPSEDASWNDIEVDDDYPVTHWMHLPSAPDRRAA